jgi:hypothetical protein
MAQFESASGRPGLPLVSGRGLLDSRLPLLVSRTLHHFKSFYHTGPHVLEGEYASFGYAVARELLTALNLRRAASQTQQIILHDVLLQCIVRRDYVLEPSTHHCPFHDLYS